MRRSKLQHGLTQFLEGHEVAGRQVDGSGGPDGRVGPVECNPGAWSGVRA